MRLSREKCRECVRYMQRTPDKSTRVKVARLCFESLRVTHVCFALIKREALREIDRFYKRARKAGREDLFRRRGSGLL